MPDVELPSIVAVITHNKWSADEVAHKLRTECTPSIVVRIHKDEVLIDLRTVTMEEEEYLLAALATL